VHQDHGAILDAGRAKLKKFLPGRPRLPVERADEVLALPRELLQPDPVHHGKDTVVRVKERRPEPFRRVPAGILDRGLCVGDLVREGVIGERLQVRMRVGMVVDLVASRDDRPGQLGVGDDILAYLREGHVHVFAREQGEECRVVFRNRTVVDDQCHARVGGLVGRLREQDGDEAEKRKEQRTKLEFGHW
jgi:hypothetical protein